MPVPEGPPFTAQGRRVKSHPSKPTMERFVAALCSGWHSSISFARGKQGGVAFRFGFRRSTEVLKSGSSLYGQGTVRAYAACCGVNLAAAAGFGPGVVSPRGVVWWRGVGVESGCRSVRDERRLIRARDAFNQAIQPGLQPGIPSIPGPRDHLTKNHSLRRIRIGRVRRRSEGERANFDERLQTNAALWERSRAEESSRDSKEKKEG